MSKPEIERMLCLSTMHIKPSTFEFLRVNDNLSGLVYYEKREYGGDAVYGSWICISRDFITAFLDEYDSYPEDLKSIIDYAISHDLAWIMLDRDIPITEDFSTYEDEWDQFFFREIQNSLTTAIK